MIHHGHQVLLCHDFNSWVRPHNAIPSLHMIENVFTHQSQTWMSFQIHNGLDKKSWG